VPLAPECLSAGCANSVPITSQPSEPFVS